MSDRRGRGVALAPEIRAEINVTPLVDVCLVLLIIFMVVTPLIGQGVDVSLPETARPAQVPRDDEQLAVSVLPGGRVFVGESEVPRAQLAAVLAQVHATTPNREVVLRGDRSLRYREVKAVMRTLEKVGFREAGLITRRENSDRTQP